MLVKGGTRQGRSGKGVMVYGEKGRAPPSADTFGLAHEAKSRLIKEIVKFFNTGEGASARRGIN